MLTISRIEALELKAAIERRSRGLLRHDAEKDRAFCSMIAERERKTRSDLSSIRVGYRDSLARKIRVVYRDSLQEKCTFPARQAIYD